MKKESVKRDLTGLLFELISITAYGALLSLITWILMR